MRVLIVSQYFWPEHFRINDLAEGLTQRGHEVTVLTGAPNYPGGRIFTGYGLFNRGETHRGVKIIRVPLIPRGSGKAAGLALNYLSFMLSASILGPVLCRESFDIIFVCQLSPVTVGVPAAFLKFIKRVPIIFWVLDLWPESIVAAGGIRSQWLYKSVGSLVRLIYKSCNHILYTSKGFTDSIQSHGVDPSRLSYFPNWVEPVEGSNAALPTSLPDGFRILFAGNVGEAQDFGTILGAAELLREDPSIQWIILGEGRQWNWVKAQVESRGLSRCFHLLGRFPSETMPAFFEQADALLVTLKQDPTFARTVPGKVPSYMSCGKPILGALDGEGADLIKEAQAGLVVSSGDAKGLANSALRLRQMSAAERARVGQSGKHYCEAHFDREHLFNQLVAAMDQLMEPTKARGA
ncbi:glycosyltransferase WbuB [Geothrix oryzae]|uniref:Glycosyltransferase WbuB n=1 Tax=Geothrix oryzae TaxID=2927975 RepID=A0ABM8DTN7_9BACT|nr:glycosyltransferase family 4 protein [Geothrix oryzae]BDU70450.1 glycosyltransferase WbuB [Geothrix oryzae]